MKKATVKLSSSGAYSQSRYHETAHLKDESHDDYRERTWREHCHYDPTTREIFIPPTAFKNMLAEAAKFKPIKMARMATFTKHFESGVMVVEPGKLGIKVDDVASETLFLPSDGKRGSGRRVQKTYPVIPEWKTEVEFLVVDDVITEPIFRQTLENGGKFIGLGRFRPRQNGFYGRFKIDSLKWEEVD